MKPERQKEQAVEISQKANKVGVYMECSQPCLLISWTAYECILNDGKSQQKAQIIKKQSSFHEGKAFW